MLFTTPKRPEITQNLRERARKALIAYYDVNPTAKLAARILRTCPEERWRIRKFELSEKCLICEDLPNYDRTKIKNLDDFEKNQRSRISSEKVSKNLLNDIAQKYCTCQVSFAHVGRVIGKGGANLKEIATQAGVIVYFDSDRRSFVFKQKITKLKNKDGSKKAGDLFQAVNSVMEALKNEETDFTDWEKYYFWWIYFNKQNK